MIASAPVVVTTTSVYNIIYIVVAITMLVAAVAAVVRWLFNRGKQTEKASAFAVALKQANDDLKKRLDHQDRELSDLKRVTKPNGLESDEIGDIAKRVENKLDARTQQFERAFKAHEDTDRAAFGGIGTQLRSLAEKLDAMSAVLNRHIGVLEQFERASSDQAREMWTAIRKKADRP